MLACSRDNIKYTINNGFLYTEEIKLNDTDKIKYLKMLDNKFSKKINFIENHVNIFNGKLTTINQDFNINNIRNADSAFIYGIIENRESGLNHELPSIKFENPYINIDNIRFENPIPPDNWAYIALKNKSNYYDNFSIAYKEFIEYYRIYTFNISRQTNNDNSNKFINIISNLSASNCTVNCVWRNYSSIKMEYNKDGLVVYKTY